MKMFGTNGIRGVANDYLNCELALKVGRSIATVLGPGPIAVASDTRVSSPMIKAAVSSGLMSMGIDVLDIGMLPTPALQYFVKTRGEVTGGVMITASHNPPEFNGIKCISADGTECSHEEESAIEDAYGTDIECVPWESIGCLEHVEGADDEYVDAIVSKVDAGAIRAAGLKVCLDCANGASVHTSPRLLEALGVEAVVLNGTPDGFFPGHYSEPTEENLAGLMQAVRETGADLGMAHDGDADRCVFVTGEGRYVAGDKALALLAGMAVRDSPGAEVVTTVATSAVVEDHVASCGGHVAYTAVGSPVVARRMIEGGGVFGGEENGGLIFADHQYCRDGGMAAARIFEAVARYGPLEDQIAALPAYHTVKDAVRCSDSVKSAITDVIAANHEGERIDRTDGLRIDYDDGWVLLRPSGTEPKYRIYSESRDPDTARSRSAQFRREFEETAASMERR